MQAPVARPLVHAVVAFGAGILLSGFITLPVIVILGLAVACLVAAVITHKRAFAISCGLFFLVFLLSGSGAALQARSTVEGPLRALDGHFVTVEGVVAEEPDYRRNGIMYILEVKRLAIGPRQGPASGRVVVVLPDYSFRYGDLIRVKGKLVLPESAGNPGAFDYRTYLERQGVGMLLRVRGDGQAVRLDSTDGRIRALASGLKEKLVGGLYKALNEDQAVVVAGITLGERSIIPQNLSAVFAATGVAHVLSVSGLHVGFLVGIVLFAARQLRAGPLSTMVGAAAVLSVYALIVGLQPPVLRASVMWMMLLGAQQLGRARDWPTAMAVAALLILILNPFALYSAGFQLSFAATWGILFIGPELVRGCEHLAGRIGVPWRTAWGWFIAVPVAAQLATWPLIAYYYNLYSTYGLLANWVVVPLVGLIFVLGMIAGLVGAVVPWLAWLIGPFTGLLVDLFTGAVRWIALLPGAAPVVASPAPWVIGIWFAVLWAAVRAAADREWRARFGALFAGGRKFVVVLLVLTATVWFFPVDRTLEVHFIDVGQGDSILLRTPGGKNLLIDSGGWPGEFESGSGAGDKVVLPYLKKLGINRIDLLVITHLHEDHAGGARALVSGLKVNALAVPAPALDRDGEGFPLLTWIRGQGIDLYPVEAGDRTAVDPALGIAFLGPPQQPLRGTGADENNNSAVLRVAYGSVVFLLTGDLESEGQERLLQGGFPLKADILKIPHHGSTCRPDFLDRVQPKVAVISVGRENRFGLPRKDTLELLEKRGIRVLRTDRDGAVIIESDGRRVRVKTGRPVSPLTSHLSMPAALTKPSDYSLRQRASQVSSSMPRSKVMAETSSWMTNSQANTSQPFTRCPPKARPSSSARVTWA